MGAEKSPKLPCTQSIYPCDGTNRYHVGCCSVSPPVGVILELRCWSCRPSDFEIQDHVWQQFHQEQRCQYKFQCFVPWWDALGYSAVSSGPVPRFSGQSVWRVVTRLTLERRHMHGTNVLKVTSKFTSHIELTQLYSVPRAVRRGRFGLL